MMGKHRKILNNFVWSFDYKDFRSLRPKTNAPFKLKSTDFTLEFENQDLTFFIEAEMKFPSVSYFSEDLQYFCFYLRHSSIGNSVGSEPTVGWFKCEVFLQEGRIFSEATQAPIAKSSATLLIVYENSENMKRYSDHFTGADAHSKKHPKTFNLQVEIYVDQDEDHNAPKDESIQKSLVKFQQNFDKDFGYKIFETSSMVTIKTCDGFRFSVNSIFMTEQSKYFEKLFTTDMKEKRTKIVEIPDFNRSTMLIVLKFLQHRLNFGTTFRSFYVDAIIEVFHAAKRFEIEILPEMCVKMFYEKFNERNALKILAVANLYDLKDLFEFGSLKVKSFYNRLKTRDEWKNLNAVLKAKILEVIVDIPLELDTTVVTQS